MAHPVPRTKAAPQKLNQPATVRPLDFEAPVTITVSGRAAAVLRFAAYLNERTPEEEALACIHTDIVADLPDGFGHTTQSADEWLVAGGNSNAGRA